MADIEAQGRPSPSPPEKKNYFRVNKWLMFLLIFLLVAAVVLAIVLPLTLRKEKDSDGSRGPTLLVPRYDVLREARPFDYPYADVPDTSRPTRVAGRAARTPKEVFDSLTWQQKIGQLSQFSRGDYSGPGLGDDSIPSWLKLIEDGGAGSFLNVNNRDDVITFQMAARDTGSKVPILMAYDTIHGYRTAFPVNLGMAASFDREMHHEYAAIAAKETLADQIRWTFGPMLDIARDPRWGRISESSGEDPYLTGELGVQLVRGFQENGVAVCVKHFAAYGAAQAGRDYHTAQLGTAYLHNDYLPAYKKALKAGALTLMASFNTVDGVPSHSNRHLLTDILRGLWGWEGLVVADYGGIRELLNHRVAGSEYEAANMSLVAGVDMAMADGYYWKYLLDKDPATAMPQGGTLGDYVDLAAKRVLAVKGALGLLDAEASVPTEITKEDLYAEHWLRDEYLQAAQRAAEKSMVLLKNEDDVLPLEPQAGARYLVLGTLADNGQHQRGSWAGQTAWDSAEGPQGLKTITYLQELKARADAGTFTVDYQPGYGLPYKSNDTAAIDEAVEQINTSETYDAIIAVVGEVETQNGEATSRTDLHLSGLQRPMLQRIREAAPGVPIILVVNAGRQLILDWEDENLEAIVYAWASGTMGGPALARILFGDVNPSGKMPVTTPRAMGQIPLYYSQLDTGRPLALDRDTNDWDETNDNHQEATRWFVSHYIDNYNKPLYYFGQGMSYSKFTYGKPTVTRDGDSITVSVTITKDSGPAGDEIVLVFVKDMVASVSPPTKRLRQFERLHFEASDASKDIEFTLNIQEDFGFYDNYLNWVVEPGTFRIIVAPNADPHFDVDQNYYAEFEYDGK